VAKAQKTKTGFVAQSVIDHGQVVDGKNVVQTFNPGDDVGIDDPDVVATLLACGALKRTTTESAASAVSDDEAALRQRREEAEKVYEATPALKLRFASVDDYIAVLDAGQKK
jgi:hypothetical protein